MYQAESIGRRNKICTQQIVPSKRKPNPDAISIEWGYQIDVLVQGLDTPIGTVITDNGAILIADSGVATGNAKVLRLMERHFSVLAEGFHVPITGINYRNGDIFVSHRGTITVIKPDGTKQDIIRGLPSYGDYSNNRVLFGHDGKMYFGQGTATNSGIVGPDNSWIMESPFFHDYPGSCILLRNVNYESDNYFIPSGKPALTGAFSSYGVKNMQEYKMKTGLIKASGSILRANLDGSELELVAWGLRNPFQINVDHQNRIIVGNQGMDNRGSRPIANGVDEFHILTPGAWYGWPDYSGGEPVNLDKFKPLDKPKPVILLETIPSIPPRPLAVFTPGSTIMGFDINMNKSFGPIGYAYVAEFGKVQYENYKDYLRTGVGHRITKVNMNNGEITTFAINKSGFPNDEGFGRPTDVTIGPDGAMYITDYPLDTHEAPNQYPTGGGVIWKVTKV